MYQIIIILHVVFAVFLIALILMQQGKGAAAGSAFGAGASGTVFGSQGAGSFMLKITALFGLLFFVTSLTLTHMATSQLHHQKSTGLLSNVEKLSQAQPHQKVSESSAKQAIQSLNAMPTSRSHSTH